MAEALPPEGEEQDEPMDAASVMLALHEGLEIAMGDESFADAMIANPGGSWSFGDDRSLTLTVGDVSKTITGDELDAAMAGDEPVEIDAED